jgi:hypothetical protein
MLDNGGRLGCGTQSYRDDLFDLIEVTPSASRKIDNTFQSEQTSRDLLPILPRY